MSNRERVLKNYEVWAALFCRYCSPDVPCNPTHAEAWAEINRGQ